ncbi:MAG TPA: NAD(P)H-dependent glycerol-3-phosphate dehydrogenase [Roseiarcus sp.]|nr:NAD(P)H-dependent glycerol-3-phosphate dehydrogenase [Roseiarcus sp.]
MRRANVIGVAGAGAWGMALANAAAAAGRTVVLWGRDQAGMRAIATTRRSDRLPGVDLARAIEATSDLEDLARCDAILAATPAQSCREMALRLATAPGSAPLITCAKGIERGTHAFMTEVLAEAAPGRERAILSGPSFAADVAAGLPTAVTLASSDEELARALCDSLRGPTLRLYHSTDVRGVEIGGAAKNVLAIACGVAAGRGLGASAVAALVARGFAELRRFGEAYGARASTLMGLSGLGDLVLTCLSPQSRNFAFGQALGRGESATQAGAGRLVEGMFTAQALNELARERGVDMPIADCVQRLIEGSLDVKAAVSALLARPPKGEE